MKNWMLIISSMLLSTTLMAETITPNDHRLHFKGSPFQKASDKQVEFLRFPSEILGKPNPRKYGFHSGKARSTAGVAMCFKTSASKVKLMFSEKACPFGVFQNGTFLETQKTSSQGALDCSPSSKPSEPIEYMITFPTWKNPLFLGMELDGSLEELSLPKKKVFVAIGDSITHGRGQDLSHQSWSWITATQLGYDYYNLAVGGSNANAYQPQSLSQIPEVDVVTMLWGYNDWVNRGKTLETFTKDMNDALDVVRKYHPNAKVFVLKLLQTKTKVSKRTKDQFTSEQFREAISSLVQKRKNEGDQKLFLIESDTMTNLNSDLRDPVHLSLEGAAKLGEKVAAAMAPHL